jgi:hypothetical protein
MFQALGNFVQGVANAMGAVSEWGFIVNDSGLVLDIAGENRQPGAKLVAWNQKNPPSDNQLFRFEGRELISKLNGFAISNVNGRLQMYPRNGTPSQQWWFDGFSLRSNADNLAVDIEGGAHAGKDIITYQPHGQINQRWRFQNIPSEHSHPVVDHSGPWGFIVNDSGLVLDVAGQNRNQGAKLCAWTRNMPPTDNQMFRFEGRELISKQTGLAVTNVNGRVQIHNRGGYPNQQWWFEGQVLKNAHDGNALDIEGGAHSGKDIITWQPHGQVNQRWRFEAFSMHPTMSPPPSLPQHAASYPQPGYPPPATGPYPSYPQPQPTFVPVPVPVPVPMPTPQRMLKCNSTRCKYFMKQMPAPHTHDFSCNQVGCPQFIKHGCPTHSFTETQY